MAIRRTTTGSTPVFVPKRAEKTEDQPASPAANREPDDAFDRAARASHERLGTPKTNDGVAGGSTHASVDGGNPLRPQTGGNSASRPLPQGERPGAKAGPQQTVADPAQFSREARLRGLLAPEVSASGRQGRADGQSLLDRAGQSPSAGDGKNQTSRQSQASDADEKIYDSSGSYVGTRGELEKQGAEIEAANAEGGTAESQLKDGNTDAELERLGRQQQDEQNAGIGSVEEAKKLAEQMGKEAAAQEAAKQPAKQPAPKGAGTKKRPNPETEGQGGGGHLGLPGRTPETPDQAAAGRRRQVTLPGDGRAQPDRMVTDANTAARQGQRLRTAGRIDPNDRGPDLQTHHRSGPGIGPERVDGRGGTPGPGGGAPSRGPTPDNPPADGGTAQDGGKPPVD